MTEEERAEVEAVEEMTEEMSKNEGGTTIMAAPSSINYSDTPLDAVQIQILRKLLHGESVRDIIKENRLMTSMVADAINEALFDEIGDTVLSCEDDVLSLVDDYRNDLAQLLGEKT